MMATPTKKILLTGFEPFGGMPTNPSEELVRKLADYRFDAMDIICEQVGRYDVIVMFGVARSRQEISVERVAINLMDAASADNAGYYAALHQTAMQRLDKKCVFIHLPLAFDVSAWSSIVHSIIGMITNGLSITNILS